MKISEDFYSKVMDDLAACDAGEFHMGTLASSIAREIVDSGDADFLMRLPARVSNEVIDLARLYERNGKLVFYSSVSAADHSEMAKDLLNVLRKNSFI